MTVRYLFSNITQVVRKSHVKSFFFLMQADASALKKEERGGAIEIFIAYS